MVRLQFENGKPTGAYEDFMTGFVQNAENVWGRPVGLAVLGDGSLILSEDGNGTIWRVLLPGRPLGRLPPCFHMGLAERRVALYSGRHIDGEGRIHECHTS